MKKKTQFYSSDDNTVNDNTVGDNTVNQKDVNFKFMVEQARSLEQDKKYDSAIDAYLKITKDEIPSLSCPLILNILLSCWGSALSIATNFNPSRSDSIVSIIRKRMHEIGSYNTVANVYPNTKHDDCKAIIDNCVEDKLFDEAQQIVQSNNPNKPVHMMSSYILKQEQEYLEEHDNVSPLFQVINMHANKGEWTQALELASEMGSGAIYKYATMYASQLIKESKWRQALSVFAKWGTSVIPKNVLLYKRIMKEVFLSSEKLSTDATQEMLKEMREILCKVLQELRRIEPDCEDITELETYLLVAHLSSLKNVCLANGLNDLAAKLSVSLLRYTNIIFADQAFYEAGALCKDQGWTNLTFVFWVRFIGLVNYLDDLDDLMDINNEDFLQTDIPTPSQVALSKSHLVCERQRDDSRDWILEKCMNRTIQTLPMRKCEKCNTDIFEGSLRCSNCKDESPFCIVSGYPVLQNTKVSCKSCKRVANEQDWYKYVSKMKTCPWCGDTVIDFFTTTKNNS